MRKKNHERCDGNRDIDMKSVLYPDTQSQAKKKSTPLMNIWPTLYLRVKAIQNIVPFIYFFIYLLCCLTNRKHAQIYLHAESKHSRRKLRSIHIHFRIYIII